MEEVADILLREQVLHIKDMVEAVVVQLAYAGQYSRAFRMSDMEEEVVVHPAYAGQYNRVFRTSDMEKVVVEALQLLLHIQIL